MPCFSVTLTKYLHGRWQKFFRGGKSRYFAIPFQVGDDAVHIDAHKTLYPFNTTKKMPRVTATVLENTLP